VGNQCTSPGGVSCGGKETVRTVFSPDGRQLERQVIGPQSGTAPWLLGRSGELVHVDQLFPRSTYLVRDAAWNVLARLDVPSTDVFMLDAEILAVGPGARVLTVERSSDALRLIQSAPDGGWSVRSRGRDHAGWLLLDWLSAESLPNGDWLLLGWDYRSQVRTRVVIERRSGVDGRIVWTQRFSEPADSFLQGRISTALDGEGGHLWLHDANANAESRAIALDLASGRFVHAELLQSADPAGIRNFSTTLMVTAPDGVIAASLNHSRESLQVKRLNGEKRPGGPSTAAAGIWNAADTPGQGFLLQTFDDGSLGGAWFTFSLAGGSDDSVMRWFALQGHPDETGSFDLTLFSASNGVFDTASAIVTEIIGSARFTLSGCDAALLTYQFTDGEMSGEGGAIPLQRTAGSATGCGQDGDAADTDAAPLRGSYFDRQTEGQGILLEAVGDGDARQLSGAWFTFDPEDARNDPSAQHWLTLLGPLSESGASTLTMYRTFGAALDLGSTMNTQAVGTMEVEVLPCGLSTAWQFDDTPAAGSLAGRSGSRMLQNVEGCQAIHTKP
jgi:hypothetical protein